MQAEAVGPITAIPAVTAVPAPESAPAPPIEASVPIVEAPWTDLALNKPGQSAREQALAEKKILQGKITRFGAWALKVLDEKTDERAWRVGANGEESVGRNLDKLQKKSYYTLHAVPVGSRGSDIDHILIGPTGVWTINTKTHPEGNVWVRGDTIKVNGSNVPYVRNSRFEMKRAIKLLSAQLGWEPIVQAAIVISTPGAPGGNTKLTVKTPPSDVFVVARSNTPKWFCNQPIVLTEAQITQVYEVARRSTTWV